MAKLLTLKRTTSLVVSFSLLCTQGLWAQQTVQRDATHTNEKKVSLQIGEAGFGAMTNPPGELGDGGATEPGLNIPNMPTRPGDFLPIDPVGPISPSNPGAPSSPILPSNPGFPGGGFGGGGNFPPNSPYAPWSPYNNYGTNGSRPGMLGITNSMVPGIVCPLVDNRPQVELMAAINNLFNYVLPDNNCYTEKDTASLQNTAIAMKTSGTYLTQLYRDINSGSVDPSSVDLSTIQQNMGALISGLDQVGKIIINNPASNGSRCGQKNLQGGELFKAITDFVTSMAPFAIVLASTLATSGAATPAALAATSGTAATTGAVAAGTAATGTVAAGEVAGGGTLISMARPALKYILGTFALSSAGKIFYDMLDNKMIDMEKPDQREALLQNLCEYFRIKQRVDYLSLADMGKVDTATARLKVAQNNFNLLKKKSDGLLALAYPKYVAQLSAIEDSMQSVLTQAQNSIRADKTEMVGITQFVNGAGNGSMCSLGRRLAKQATDSTLFPGRTIQTYNSILQRQTRITTEQYSILDAETSLRNSLNSKDLAATSVKRQCAPGTNCSPNAACAEVVKDYIGNLNKMIADAEMKVRVLQSSLQQQLNKDPDFKDYKTVKQAVTKELMIRESTGKLVASLSGDNAAIVWSEINRQMEILKLALFAKNGWMGTSPVLAWLESTSKQYRLSLNAYSKELDLLIASARQATRSFQGNFKVQMKDGKVRNMSPQEVDKQILTDIEAVNKLGVINAQMAPQGSPQRQTICQKLTNLNLIWHQTLGHLKAEKFFCENIKSMVDITAQSSITSFCFGNVNVITGQVYKKSGIDTNLDQLTKDYGPHASLIDAKFKELKCETKDATEVMQ
jgi:hypothetical protein